MSLQEFRQSFIKYAANGFELPEKFHSASDLELVAVINQYIRPFANNLDLALSNLETLIIASGREIPQLNDEQKTKLKRYLQAFIECTA